MAVGEGLENIEWKVSSEDQDEDGFVSIWNICSATMESDQGLTRALASAVMGFLCKKECDFIVVSGSGIEYLDNWFEKDNKILFQWKPEHETVDVIAQHAEVPYKALVDFLKNKKFKSTANYSPRRADRLEWFQNKWNVG